MTARRCKILASCLVGAAIIYFLISPQSFITSIGSSVQSEKQLIQANASYIKKQILSNDSKITLLNIWASWCSPCKEEMPHLLKLKNIYKQKGFELVLVSADRLEEKGQVEKLLLELNVDFPSFIRGEQEISFISELSPSWQGGIPASLIFNHRGEILEHWQGSLPYEALEKKILRHLDNNNVKSSKEG